MHFAEYFVWFFFVLLLGLGFWQLDRAWQKDTILQQQIDSKKLNRISYEELLGKNAPYRYRKITATGTYDKRQFLLDNQIQNGKAGYFVLTPLQMAGGKAILVNRGWLPLGSSRKILPAVGIATKTVTISGRVNNFPSVGLVLKGAHTPSDTSPAVVQVVNAKILGQKLGYPLQHLQIELDANSGEGYQRNWQTSKIITPERHIAYAVQWFLLALALTVLFVFARKKRKL